MNGTPLTPKASEAIAQHIEMLILEGVLRPGEKLISERELAAKLEVSRPTLRDAIAALAARGLLTTTRGGTYVAQFLSPVLQPLASLLSDKPEVTQDYFEFRSILEGEAAGLAAVRATEVDRKALEACLEQIEAAHKLDDPAEEAEADVGLHVLVYEISHNVVLLHVMRAMSELLRNEIFYNRQQLYLRPGVREPLYKQHLAIGRAILSGDREAARKAAMDHMRFTRETIDEIRRGESRLEASLHRVGRSELLSSSRNKLP
ncbi:MAG: FCD domain-containing protein [Alphaproteobacteria bacterium]|nr:FCD domain-containing protein [Alphaproteobacteria bacterium]